MTDLEKNYIVDPYPAWNYIGNPRLCLTFNLPSHFTLGKQNALHDFTPTPPRRITAHMPPPLVYEVPAVAVL